MAGTLPTSIALDAPVFRRAQQCGAQGLQIPSPGTDVDGRFGPSGPPPAIGMFVVLQPGCTLSRTGSPSVSVLAVALNGTIQATGEPNQTAQLTPWNALVSHGSPVRFEARNGPAGVYVLALSVPVDVLLRPVWSVRSLAEQEDLSWAGGAFHARFFQQGPPPLPTASLEVLLGSRDAPVLEHDHPQSWEILAPIFSAGRLHTRVRSNDGSMRVFTQEVNPGEVQYVPPGVRHAWEPNGTEPLLALQSYTPPGPEQRMVALAHPDAGAPARK